MLNKRVQKSIKRILLVDDDMKFVKLVKDSLIEEGYTVFCGYDGHMALDLAKMHRPDLILMDVTMPMMDGIQAFQKLRAVAHTSRIPVIFISELGSHVLYPILKSEPRSAYLKKPFDLLELTSITRQFINSYAA